MATAANAAVKSPRGSLEIQWNGQATAPVQVLTVDRDPLVREGLAAVIHREPGMELAAQASSTQEAFAAYRKFRPDVVTLDLGLADATGEEFIRRLLEEFPDARIVAVTAGRGDVHMLRILEAGVQGLLLKGASSQELLDVIRQVHAGKKVVPRPIAATIAEHLADESLTPREIQVLQLVARGNRNKEVAVRLSIADETVRMHMKNILAKLGANDRTHAVTIALKRGFFQL